MDFKRIFILFSFAIGCLLNMACDPGPNPDYYSPDKQEDIIGTEVQSLSFNSDSVGINNSSVVIFDQTTRLINRFDSESRSKTHSFPVTNPGEKHLVVSDPKSSQIVDLQKSEVSFYSTSLDLINPLEIQGELISIAYRPDLKKLLAFDNNSNVYFYGWNESGLIDTKVRLGPIVTETSETTKYSLRAGDLLNDGNLVLSTTSDVLILVNSTETLKQQKWVKTELSTQFKEIRWIAPTDSDDPNVVLMLGKYQPEPEVSFSTSVLVYNLNTKTVLASKSLENYKVIRYSKHGHPHILLSNGNQGISNIHVKKKQGSSGPLYSIEEIKISNFDRYIVSSYLDLTQDEWMMILRTESFEDDFWTDSIDQYKKSRELISYRPSDLLVRRRVSLIDGAQIRVGTDHYLALFPTKLGYAFFQSLSETKSKIEIKGFNVLDL